jgi:TolB protein
VNSAGDEWAPGVSPDGRTLLFASDGRGGQGKHDLFIAQATGARWSDATPVPGAINTPAEEFDATFLSDGTSLVFARSPNIEKDRITLTFAARQASGYPLGIPLPFTGAFRDTDALGPAINWHNRSALLFTAAAMNSSTMRPDIYEVRYRLR